MRTIYILLLIILCPAIGWAQSRPSMEDSLEAVAAEYPDTSKARIYNNISWDVHREHPDLALTYAQKAIDYARKFNNKRELCLAYNWAGVNLRTLGEVAQAIDYYNKSIEVAQQIDWKMEEGYGYNNLGIIYYMQGNYSDAEKFLKKAEQVALDINDNRLIGYAYGYLGEVYCGMKEYDKALQHLEKSYQIRLEFNDIPTLNAIEKSIGNVYFASKDYPKAKQYYHKVWDKNMANPDIEQLVGISLNMAQIFYEENNLDSALLFAQYALRFGEQMGNKSNIRNAYKILGFISYSNNDYPSAASYLMTELAYNDSIANTGRAQKVFDVQAVMAKYQKDEEIRKMNETHDIQILVLTVSLVLLAIAILAYLWLRANRKSEGLLNETLSLQKTQITDSINYARKIQDAILPEDSVFCKNFSDRLTLYKPRETVSGNFYWYHDDGQCEIVAVADCISRNVAGAFMTLQGCTALQEIATRKRRNACEILQKINVALQDIVKHEKGKQETAFHMNIALAIIDKESRMLDYAGAKLPLIHVRDGKATVLEPSQSSVGNTSQSTTYVSREMLLAQGDCIYMSADGFAAEGKGSNPQPQNGYIRLLENMAKATMQQQRDAIEQMYDQNKDMDDDICVIGFRI